MGGRDVSTMVCNASGQQEPLNLDGCYKGQRSVTGSLKAYNREKKLVQMKDDIENEEITAPFDFEDYMYEKLSCDDSYDVEFGGCNKLAIECFLVEPSDTFVFDFTQQKEMVVAKTVLYGSSDFDYSIVVDGFKKRTICYNDCENDLFSSKAQFRYWAPEREKQKKKDDYGRQLRGKDVFPQYKYPQQIWMRIW